MIVNLLSYLENACKHFPDKIAFADENENITFSELMRMSRGVGTYIAAATGAQRLPVSVMTNKTVADVAAFFGALYAGCFYVPLDASAPKAHIDARQEAVAPALTIQANKKHDLPMLPVDTALLADIRKNHLPIDPAYAMFTSGSTGTPKAALISHGGVINLIEWMCDEFAFSEATVFGGLAPFYFDLSVHELYGTLRSCGSSYFIHKKHFISPLKALQIAQEAGATCLPWSVAAMRLVATSGALDRFVPDCVTDIIYGGENMTGKIFNIWQKALPSARFINGYGPAETTVDCSYYVAEPGRLFDDGESVPIGFPVRGYELLLLDEEQNPVPRGEKGEIYVRGAGVGLGYYNNPQRTAEAFIQNPHLPYRDIIYRTGDIARQNERGELVFLTRADNQVKHMGSRVELGEIETIANGLEGVDAVCCSYDRENLQILMFYEGSVTQKELSAQLNAKLPKYMYPGVIEKLDKMPMMPGGKIDRQGVRKAYDDTR